MLRMTSLLGCLLLLTISLGSSSAWAVNRALSLDGSGDYVVVQRQVQNDFTIEFWMRTTHVHPDFGQWWGGAGVVDNENYGAGNDFGIAITGTKVAFGTGATDVVGDITIKSTTDVNTGIWFHIAATRRMADGAMILYVNGVKEAEAIGTTQVLDSVPDIYFGMMHGSEIYFNGLIDEVRIWNVARTQEEIQQDMHRRLTGTAPGLVSYWTFDNENAVDESGNGNNGTLIGDAKIVNLDWNIPGVTTNMLTVTGTVYRETGEVAENGLPVEVKNITQNLTETDVTGGTAGDGQYAVTFFDANKPVAKARDEILVTVKDQQGRLVGQSRHTLTISEVEAKATIIDVIPDSQTIQFTLNLFTGLNLVSIPVDLEGWRMSDLANHIGKDNLSMIIRYDYTRNKFISYLPTFPDDSPANVLVQCGEGYIVVMKVKQEVVFEGNPCEDEIAAPSFMPLLLSSDNQSASIFVVTGNVRQEETGDALNEVAVKIRNLRTSQTVEDVTGTLAGYGNYVATFVASSEEFMTHTGDKLEITVMDKGSRFVVDPVNHILTTQDISAYVLFMPLHLSLPESSALLQNYPNPFNPETWLPYQLAQDADVTISIYNIKGQLARTLHLGNQSAGVYVMKNRAAYWDGRDSLGQQVASGVYFYTLQTGKFRATRKMVILK